MRRPVFLLALSLVSCRQAPTAREAAAHKPPSTSELVATYLANEGVLLESGGTRVIIDGLLRPHDMEYAVMPGATRELLETATPPWDGIDLVLVSHMHADHFHPQAVGRFLASATGARLVTSEEVAEQIERLFPDWSAIRDRVKGVAWAVGREETVEANGAQVTFVGLSHGTGKMASVQNFGQLVRIGGFTVFHAGDGVASAANYAGAGLERRGIDVAFVPWWYLASDENADVLRRFIAPRRVALIHCAPRDEGAALEAIRARAPDAVLFRRMLEDRISLAP